MKKSKLASGLAVSGGALALALAFTLTPSHVAAIPYASLIRVNDPIQLVGYVDLDVSYSLNEDVDKVTVQLFNTNTNVVLKTYVFNSPDAETVRGRHTLNWDGVIEGGAPAPANTDPVSARITVEKTDGSTAWTKLSSNAASASPKVTEKKSLFSDWQPADIIVPQVTTADSFGFIITPHGYGSAPASPEVGLAFLQPDLEPFAGDGGGVNLRMRNNNQPGNTTVPWWNGDMDPVDPEMIWISGQSPGHVVGVGRVAGGSITDISASAAVAWNSAAVLPRGIAVRQFGGTRFGYVMNGNSISRYELAAAFPHAFTGAQVNINGGTAVRYAQDIEFDTAGNLYFLSRSAVAALSELWRWSAADVQSAAAGSLTEANAQWRVVLPAADYNSIIVDRSTGYAHSGNVYVHNNNGTPRGVWLVGKASTSTIGTGEEPHVLDGSALFIDGLDTNFFDPNYGTAQLTGGIETDWLGNLYMASGGPPGLPAGREIHSFSPPAKATAEDPDVVHTITTTSPPSGRFLLTTAVNNVTVNKSFESPNNINAFNSLAAALASYGAGGPNHNFPGPNIIAVEDFGPYDEELPDVPDGFDSDTFQITAAPGGTLVLQRGSTWALGANVSINGLVIASSSTSTPTGTLVSSTGGTQTITNSRITALPAAASSYTQASDIPAGIADGTAAYDGSLVRAGDGLTVAGGTVNVTNSIINQHTRGVVSSSGSLTVLASQVVSNNGNGVTNTGADLTLSGAGIQVSNNAGTGISTSGGALSLVGTYASPVVLANNTVAGIAINGGSSYEIRNTIANNSPVGLDIGSAAPGYDFGDYRVTDSIFSNSSTAGIRIADARGFSMERVTLHANAVGILDPASRNNFWSLELRDTIISGPGGTGIQSGTVGGSSSILLGYSALVTAGPNALATANTASAGTDVASAIINADPEYRSTTYSSNRLNPDFYLAPSAAAYLGAAAPAAENGGSPFFNLGGGSRWTLGPSITTVTVGSEGQLYPTLADAIDGVNNLGTTGGIVLTVLIETNLTETRVSRLGVDTGEGGGVLIRPKDGLDLTVDWATTPQTSGLFYSGQLAIGANQGVSNNLVMTNNVVVDGKPAGSPAGTALTFSGPGRHINLTGGAKNTVIRNMRLNSTLSSGAVIAVNALNAGGVDYHPDGLLIEHNLIQALAAAGHVGIVLQAQSGVLTTAQEDLTIRHNRIEYQSSAVFLYPSALNAQIHGNTFYGRQANASGVDARGFYLFTSVNYAQAPEATLNVYNNVFDLVGLNAATHGQALVSLDYGASSNVQTINFYNNFVTMRHDGTAVPLKYQAFVVGAVANTQLNILHNSVHMRTGSLGTIPTLNTATTGLVSVAATNPVGLAKINARNNLIRVEEPQVSVFTVPAAKLGDIVEDYNTVYRVPIDPGTGVVSPIYGRIDATNHQTLAEWQAASGKGANSDEAVIGIDPEENPAEGFTGVWTAAPDRLTDPNAPTPANYRWTAVPGDSAVWGGVPGLLASLPGGDADIDGTARHAGKPYRGAHEGATLPGDNIDPDPEGPDAELGDINEDGTINVADVTELANIIAAGQQGTLDLAIADVNGDSAINALDVEALADLIVNPVP